MVHTAAALNRFVRESTLTLFVFWILTNDSDTAFSLDDLAFLADRFYRRSYLHDESSFLMRLKMILFPAPARPF